ncbi:type I restriction endonuclease [Paractinoplanes durhamensis]|uniref:type I restriction endonuclease n=1 Tax=Paractinoplanes durhamensis TaxID=113563 RepID=UPI003635FD20
MSPIHHESAFGDAIVASLAAGGWEVGSSADYRADIGFDTGRLFEFVGDTQAAEWADVVDFYGGDPNAAQRGFVKRLDQAITSDGLLDVLRKGVKDHGVRIRVAYFKPSFVESDEILADYRKNRLSVVRELAYATKQADRGNRLDLTLFLNGIPVATAELKNPLTGSGWSTPRSSTGKSGTLPS